MTATAFIGLGSNLGEPADQLTQAFQALNQIPLTRVTATSPLYRSAPVGPQDQPDFVNAVATLVTRLSPLALLDQLQAIEQAHRRIRARHWGPRTLDLDLLWFEHQQMTHPRLRLPHPEMVHRAFVMIPLADVAPTLMIDEQTVRRRADNFPHQDVSLLIE